jgi:hypothetical protein
VRGCDAPAAPSLRGSRLTRRGRLAVTLAWLVLAALAAWPVLGGGSDHTTETIPVRVEVGDTLWQLAIDAAPGTDPRRVVDEIVKLNGLRDGGDIRPGDTLQIPVSGG